MKHNFVQFFTKIRNKVDAKDVWVLFRVGRAMRTLFFIAGGGEGKMLALKISFCELNYMRSKTIRFH